MAYINGKKVITCVLANEVKDEVNVEAALDMANGDQVIAPPDDTKTMSQVLVKKPETLIADNIKKDINIGGIVGTFEGLPAGISFDTDNYLWLDYQLQTERVYISELNDQTAIIIQNGSNEVFLNNEDITLSSNNLSSVTFTEDYIGSVTAPNLTAENIKKDTTILGVTGTLESGGGTTLKNLLDATKSTAYLFSNYTGESIDGLIAYNDTSEVTNASNMFYLAKQLKTVPLFDTSKVTNAENMFATCSNLTEVPAFDVSNITVATNMFMQCSQLTAIHMYGLKVNLNLSASTKFTREALVEILNNLATVTVARTLTIGTKNLAKLTDEDKAIATNKGWTLA